MNMRNWAFAAIAVPMLHLSCAELCLAGSDVPELIQLYTQDELNELISRGEHLRRIVIDECQFTKDIRDRALVLHYPSYLYLWGDMNLTDTCIKGVRQEGVKAMAMAADKGMPIAMYRLGMMYLKGEYVQQNDNLAYSYFYRAASLGNPEARVQLVDIMVANPGHEADFERAYNWLHFTVFRTDMDKKKAETSLAKLGALMPPSLVKKASSAPYD